MAAYNYNEIDREILVLFGVMRDSLRKEQDRSIVHFINDTSIQTSKRDLYCRGFYFKGVASFAFIDAFEDESSKLGETIIYVMMIDFRG